MSGIVGCNIACTSKPQQWHKPKSKGKIHDPDFVKNVIVHQAKGQFHTTPDDFVQSRRSSFDPRLYKYRKKKSLSDFNLEKLKTVTGGNSAILLYTPFNDKSNKPSENPIANHHLNMQSIPSIADEILYKSQGISFENFERALSEKIQIDQETIDYIANSTKSQSASSTWASLRHGRITASKVLSCTRNVHHDGSVSNNNKSLLGDILAYRDSYQTYQMKHGLKMERTCINHYTALQKKKHKDFEVTPTGLHICQKYPFIAGSPDSLIKCSCPAESECKAEGQTGCLEVKNPFTNDEISEWAKKPRGSKRLPN